jgi:predicted GIY-YIG superfamily endonuclease
MTERKMAFTKWWTFNDNMVSYDLDNGAVYEFADANGTIVYIGSTNALKRRMREHLSEDAKSCIKTNAKQYRYDYRSDCVAEEKRLYAVFVQTNGKPPRCNTIRP